MSTADDVLSRESINIDVTETKNENNTEKDIKFPIQEKASELDQTPSQPGTTAITPVEDAVFGQVGEHGPNYRSLGWIATIALMMKTQIGLGILGIPMTFHELGIVPGVMCLCAVGTITTWSDYIIGVFKRNHPEVYTIDDAGFKMFGKIGRNIFATIFLLNWVFVAGSAMLSISIGFNAVSTHAACTAVFVAVAAILTFLCASIRTLSKVSWLAWIGLICIMTAIFSVTIAVGVEDRPAAAPRGPGQWHSDYKLTNSPSFVKGVTAISCHIFAYAGTPAYFSIIAEMKEPKHYNRSLIWAQTLITVTYIIVGCIVYYFCGSYVASPALGSAGVVMKKVCYGFALPGLIVTAMIVTHPMEIPAKYIFLRILRGSEHLHRNSLVHWGTWLGCTSGVTFVAYIIASAIPVFGSLVSLIGSSFGTFLCFQPYGCMWLYDNWGSKPRDIKWSFMVGWSVFVIAIGTFFLIAGTYGSIVAIVDASKSEAGSSWSCADNSNSVPRELA
ncbi:amino acid transporter [Fusarium heterosporum]|uniref:Amino acid transporter n=1 Tax=Fusarium heterosporum TaxID=42747 RepID=A0A8H5SPR7_FUSHE|nr:amino acid transporter [Fusarium heterosporum]